MRSNIGFLHTLQLLLLLLVSLISLGGSLRGEELSEFSMRVDAFRSLDDAERKSHIRDAFLHRIEHAQNVMYDSVITMRNHKAEGVEGELGEVVWDGVKYGYKHWKLGDSYLVETSIYGRPSNARPTHTIRSSYDAEAGVTKGTVVDSAGKKSARIDTKHSAVLTTNRFGYWLTGDDNGFAQYVFPAIIRSYEAAVLGEISEAKTIDLEVPWKPTGIPGAVGRWVFTLSPEKGFLPIAGIGSWERNVDGQITDCHGAP